MGESFLERLFELLILKARFGGDNASRATVVGLGLLLRFEGRAI